MIERVLNKARVMLDRVFLNTDRKDILRTRNIRRIPGVINRRGGKLSYAEWAHVIGIFQTLFYENLDDKTGNKILDIGCGTGLLAMAAEPFVSNGGKYTGIDVMREDIEFCQQHYPDRLFDFKHFDLENPTYASAQSSDLKPWPVEDKSYDLVTALSVWTHLREEHARYYFREIARVLKPGGKAVVSFFYLDELYQESLAERSDAEGRYHSTNQELWIFDKPAYDSVNWLSPGWVKEFEDAIGLTPQGMDKLLTESGLGEHRYYPGNWKEKPGLYFQDVFVFTKR